MAEGEVLNQSEVDALLSAIDSGEIELETVALPQRAAAPYDFKRPERVSRDQLRSIETLHEVFARNLQASLSGALRTIINVKVETVDQLTYSEFIMSLPNPTCFNLVTCAPLEGNMILEINPSTVFPIIDRLLGGQTAGAAGTTQPERPLTDIEWNLIQSVIDQALEALRNIWAPIEKIDFRVNSHETNPQLMPLMSPNESVVLVSLKVVMGEQKGFLNLCIPVVTIEGVLDKISNQSWFGGGKKGSAPLQTEAISRSITNAELEVSVFLAETQIRLSDLIHLQVGDILTTDHPTGFPMLVCIEGRPKFWGNPGDFKNHKAVRILRPVKSTEETFR